MESEVVLLNGLLTSLVIALKMYYCTVNYQLRHLSFLEFHRLLSVAPYCS